MKIYRNLQKFEKFLKTNGNSAKFHIEQIPSNRGTWETSKFY